MKAAIYGAIGLAGLFVAGSIGKDDPVIEVPQSRAAQSNLGAFLSVIRAGESSDNYGALVGGGEFTDYTAHPWYSEGWRGIKRADGRLTTAAGAYQITRTTYDDLTSKFAFPGPDLFSPQNQDAMAIRLLIRRGAFDHVLRGDIQSACAALRDEWEIFKTPKFSPDRVVSFFQTAGGFTA